MNWEKGYLNMTNDKRNMRLEKENGNLLIEINDF